MRVWSRQPAGRLACTARLELVEQDGLAHQRPSTKENTPTQTAAGASAACESERDAQRFSIAAGFPASEQVGGERMCRSAAPVLRVSFLSVLSLIFPPSFRCVSVFASHAWQQSSVLWGASRVSPGENRLRKFRVLADSRVATCSGAECETCFGFRSRRGMAL